MIILRDTDSTVYLQRHVDSGVSNYTITLTNTLNGYVKTISSITDEGDAYKYKFTLPNSFLQGLVDGEYLLTVKNGDDVIQQCVLRYGTFTEQGDVTYEG